MSFDIFENIFTASDPAGGRAIKVSTTAGIDNAESYYTISDPAGGRAIKVKLIGGGGGGGSTGTLQTLGGVPLSSSLVFITDSATPSANYSPLLMSTGSLEVRRTGATGTYLFTVDGGGSDGYARINSGDGYTSVLEFSTGGSALKIGDVRGDTTNGMAMTSSVAFPIKFYTNGDLVNQAIDLDTVGTLNAYFSITLKDLASAGNSKIAFNYSSSDTQIGLISATESNFEVSSKNGRPLSLSTSGSAGSMVIDNDGTVNTIAKANIGTNLSINGTAGTGYIYLTSQSSAPAGASGKLALWSDSGGKLSWRQGTGSSATIDNADLTAARLYKLPNADTYFAGLNLAQTFTSAQTVSILSTVTSALQGLAIQAGTPATSLVPNQYSPSLMLMGRAWNTTSTGSSVIVGFRAYAKTFGNSTNPTSSIALEGTVDGTTYSEVLGVTTGGTFTFRSFAAFGFPSSGIINISAPNLTSNITRINLGPNNASTTPALAVVTTSGTGDTISAIDSRTSGAAAVFLRGKLSTHAAYVGTTITPTGYLVIYDSTGTSYRIPAVAGA